MNSPESIATQRARLFSFVSVKKKWQEEEAKAQKKVELDIVVPKGRERQKTVVYYLNQDQGIKLQEVVEVFPESENEDRTAQTTTAIETSSAPTTVSKPANDVVDEVFSKMPVTAPTEVSSELSKELVQSDSLESDQGEDIATRRRSTNLTNVVRQLDRSATLEMIKRVSSSSTSPSSSSCSSSTDTEEFAEGEQSDDGIEEPEGSKKAEKEEEYSSEEEVEEEGQVVVRPSRSKTLTRQRLEKPVMKEGWGKKCGVEGYKKTSWQKRYFILEYPFLDILDKKGGKLKGRISMRGGILIDEMMSDEEKKYKKNIKKSFKMSVDAKHKIILQFKTPQEKNEWVKALWCNIYYANPAKQPGGANYKVSKVNEEKNNFIINTSMNGVALFLEGSDTPLWYHPFHHLRIIVLPEKDVSENWITFDFSKYGGAKVMHLEGVSPMVIYKSFASLFEACTAWRNTPLLQQLYGSA